MNKTKKSSQVRTLELKKETIVQLNDVALHQVAGGNRTTILSQCPTQCF